MVDHVRRERVPTLRWPAPVQVSVGAIGIEMERAVESEGAIRLVIHSARFEGRMAQDLVRTLVSIEGVVPDGATRDLAGYVVVPDVRPTGVRSEALSWKVSSDLTLICDESGIWLWSYRAYEVDLDVAQAWRLVQAISGARAWLERMEDTGPTCRSNRRLSALQTVSFGASCSTSAPTMPTAEMFEYRARAEVEVDAGADGRREFVVDSGHVDARSWNGPDDTIRLILGGPQLGLEALDLLATYVLRSGMLPEHYPPEEGATSVDFELMEPEGIAEDGVWWGVTAELWVVQRGRSDVYLVRPGGDGWSPPVVELDATEAAVLVAALMSARTWIAEIRTASEAAIAARRAEMMQAPPTWSGTMFESETTVGYWVGRLSWPAPVQIDLSKDGLTFGRGEPGDAAIALLDRTGSLPSACQQQLAQHLLRIEGVVPLEVPRGSHDCISVPCAEPTQITRHEVQWCVSNQLMLVCDDGDGIQLRLTPEPGVGHQVARLTLEQGWKLACALAAAKHWIARVERHASIAAATLRIELMRAAGSNEPDVGDVPWTVPGKPF